MAERFGGDERHGGILVRHRIGDPQFIAQASDFVLSFVDLFFLFLELGFQGLDAAEAPLFPLLQAMVLIRFGDRLGQFRGLLGFFTINTDLDQAGIANRTQDHSAFEQTHRFGGFERAVASIVLSAPFFVQAQVIDDLAEDDFGLDEFKLGLNEVRIVAAHHPAVGEARDVRLVVFDLDAGAAGVRFGEDKGHQRCRDDDEQKDGQDDGLANANDAPIIQEVQFRFLWRRCFYWIHKSKKRGASHDSPAPSHYFKVN